MGTLLTDVPFPPVGLGSTPEEYITEGRHGRDGIWYHPKETITDCRTRDVTG